MQASPSCVRKASGAIDAFRAPHRSPRFRRAAAVAVRRGALALALLAGLPLVAASQPALQPDAPVRFGILPLGGAFESRSDWDPLLAELSRAISRPVSVLSVNSYEALEQAI